MKTLTGNTIRTVTGKYIDFTSPNYKLVEIEDIASGLSRICRFGGQLDDWVYYSVAEHSVHCVKTAMKDGISDEKLLLAILLHDGAEAYCGDVVKPLKNLLGDCYTSIEKQIEDAIARRFKIDFDKNHDIIKKYDIEVLYAEKDYLFLDHMGVSSRPEHIRKIDVKFKLYEYMAAKLEFLNIYYKIRGV